MAFRHLSDMMAQERYDILMLRITDAIIQNDELVVYPNVDPEVITSSKERREHGQSADREWLQRQLAELKAHGFATVAHPRCPLEFLTGDVCPIFVLNDGKRYTVSFYRGIWPKGWIIPGGCAGAIEDIFDPIKLAARECAEELLIMDDQDNFYSLGLPQNEVMARLNQYGIKQINEIKPVEIRILPPLPGHAKRIRLVWRGEERIIAENTTILIDPLNVSIPITVYWEIRLPLSLEQIRIFDGETFSDGRVINRPVRLINSFEVFFLSDHNVLASAVDGGWLSEMARYRVQDPTMPEEEQLPIP